jgi:hypothetical protein
MRVTFDTNALADVVLPETSQRATGLSDGSRVRAAIQAGKIQGVFCEVLITLEGITNADRSAVFGSTEVNATYRHENAPDGSGVTYINSRVEQPGRRPLDRRQADRFLGAFALGMKLLGAPRLGMIRVDDPNGDRYADEPNEAELSNRLDRYHQVTEAIEVRGLGCAQAKFIAQGIQARIAATGLLWRASDIRKTQQSERRSIVRSPSGPTATVSPPIMGTALICFAVRTSARMHRLHRSSTTKAERG